MKLVEILAKELAEWPERVTHFSCDEDGEIRGRGGNTISHDFFPVGEVCNSDRGDLQSGVLVTREMWQAERDRKKGGEWKRHRGGRCPVHGDQQVEVKFRDGAIEKSHASDFFGWRHREIEDPDAHIMSYRVISQPQAEEVEVLPNEKTSQVMDATDRGEGLTRFANAEALMANLGIGEIIHGPVKMGDTVIAPAHPEWEGVDAEPDCSVGQWHQIDGPIKWRDQIIELEAHEEDIQREIAMLFAKLNAEGFQLVRQYPIVSADVPAVDMSDWRKWKVGDIVSIKDDVDVDDGEYSVLEIDHSEYKGYRPIRTDDGWPDIGRAKIDFIRRP